VFSEQDGLQGNILSTDRQGKVYLGRDMGLKVFHPKNVKTNPYIPSVVLTNFMLSNKPVAVSDTSLLKQHISLTKQIDLDYTDYIFGFEFAALSYNQPEKNQYKYILEGYDHEWLEADYLHRRVNYTNVPHGKYTFRVMASNNDGVWNEEGVSLKVIIHPPWWLTW